VQNIQRNEATSCQMCGSYVGCTCKYFHEYEYLSVTEEQYAANRADMKKRFKQTEMLRQIKVFTDRKNWVKTDEVSNWFLQSRERLAIFHLFNISGYPEGFSVNMVSRSLELPRTTTSRLLSDCYQQRLIYKNPKKGKSRFYLPSDHILRNGDYWCEYFIDTILALEMDIDRSTFFDCKMVEYKTRLFSKTNVTPKDVDDTL